MGPKRNGSSSTPSRQASSSISGSKPSPVTLDNSSLAEEILTNMRSQVELAVSNAMKDILLELQLVKEENKQLKTQIAELEEAMILRVDDLEQYGRRHSLRIFGVPEKANEDTDVEAMKIFKEKLGIDVQLEEINRSHRVGKPQPPAKDSSGRPRPRPIIIRFLSYRTRRRIFEAKSALKGTNITIREDLTKHRLRILNAAVDRFGVKSVWSVDGRIKIATNNGGRKVVHTIERLSELQKISHMMPAHQPATKPRLYYWMTDHLLPTPTSATYIFPPGNILLTTQTTLLGNERNRLLKDLNSGAD